MKYIKTYEKYKKIFEVNDIIVNKHGFFMDNKNNWLEPGEKFIIIDIDDYFYTYKELKTNYIEKQAKRWVLTNFVSEEEWKFITDIKKFNL